MHSSSQLGGLSAAHIHQAILDAHHLTPDQYTRNQLAYDLRKLRAHGLIVRASTIIEGILITIIEGLTIA